MKNNFIDVRILTGDQIRHLFVRHLWLNINSFMIIKNRQNKSGIFLNAADIGIKKLN